MAIGTLGPLSPGEVEKCGGHNLGSRGVERAWEYWVTRLQKAEAMWAAAQNLGSAADAPSKQGDRAPRLRMYNSDQ